MTERPPALARLIVTSIFLIGGACSSASKTSDQSALASQCSWSASLDDAGPGGCRAQRAIVTCSDPAGDSCFGLSDDPTSCSICGSGFANPTNKCAAGEYGVACGAVGPSAIQAPPDGCASAGVTPAGLIFYCCPCG